MGPIALWPIHPNVMVAMAHLIHPTHPKITRISAPWHYLLSNNWHRCRPLNHCFLVDWTTPSINNE